MKHNTQPFSLLILTYRVVLTAILAIVIPFAILACSQQPIPSSTDTDKAADTDKPKTGAADMKAYKDPETGKLGPPPQGASVPESSEALKNATSTSSEGLEEKPAPGGGTMIDLKGRFQSTGSATKADDKASEPASAKKEKRGSNLRAYKDPETGKLGPPPQGASVPKFSEAMTIVTSTSTEGLEEEPAPGGGMMLDLKGRFGSLMFATKDQSGKITTSHAPYPQPN